MHPNVQLTNGGKFVCTLTSSDIEISHSKLVFVGARSARDNLYTELRRDNYANLFRAGDCISPGIIQAAVLSGHTTAQEILHGNSLKRRREQVPVQFI